MKFVGFLLLAVFASCKAATMDEIRRIEQESNSKIMLSSISRSLGNIAPRAPDTNPPAKPTPQPTPGNNICEDNKLWFIDFTVPKDDPNYVVSKDCKDVVNYREGYCNCDLNNCQRTAPTNCPVQPVLDCTGVPELRKFPSETKCDEYRICIQGKLVPGKCLKGLRFDSRADGGKGQCTSVVSCPSPLRCPSGSISKPTFTPFRLDKRYALYCYGGKSKVVTCPIEKDGKLTHEWDNNGRCSYECNASGTFADTDPDSDKYYTCVGSRYPFRKTEYQCGKGNVFDEGILDCKTKGPSK